MVDKGKFIDMGVYAYVFNFIRLKSKQAYLTAPILWIMILFSPTSFSKNVILFVTTDGQQNQIRDSDLLTYKQFQESLERFLVKNVENSSKIVVARLSDINDLPSFVDSSLGVDDRIKLIVFQGHGNNKEMVFDLANRFEGHQLAKVISESRILNRVAIDNMSVYFSACQCGLNPGNNSLSFQEEFSEHFIQIAKSKGKVFGAFQSVAHSNLFNNYATIPGVDYISWLIHKSGFYPLYQKILLAGRKVPGKWGEALEALASGQIRGQLAVLASIGLSFLIEPDSAEMRFLAYAPAISAFLLTYLELMQVGVVKNIIYSNGKIVKNERPLSWTMRSLNKVYSKLSCQRFYN